MPLLAPLRHEHRAAFFKSMPLKRFYVFGFITKTFDLAFFLGQNPGHAITLGHEDFAACIIDIHAFTQAGDDLCDVAKFARAQIRGCQMIAVALVEIRDLVASFLQTVELFMQTRGFTLVSVELNRLFERHQFVYPRICHLQGHAIKDWRRASLSTKVERSFMPCWI